MTPPILPPPILPPPILPPPVRQPGPPSAVPAIIVPARAVPLRLTLPAGRLLRDAVAAGFAAEGLTSGVVTLRAVPVGPFAYVIPALSPDDSHAAFYSDTFRPPAVTMLDAGALTFGTRDGAAFFHGHALWTLADGRVHGGHILPDETVLAATVTVEALGLAGAAFTTGHDPETGFSLFTPHPAPRPDTGSAGGACLAVRLCPNQDLHAALEEICIAHGFTHARIRGGVGSTIGANFADGQSVTYFATEVFIRDGQITPGPDGAPQAVLNVGLVDHSGAVTAGRLQRGANRVLMTFEFVVEAL